MAERVSGEGPWVIHYLDDGESVAEIFSGNGKFVVGQRRFIWGCARCGTQIPVCTPENEEMAVCNACMEALAKEFGDG